MRAFPVANAPDDVQLQWTAPSETIDGYLVELKIGAGAYQPQNDLATLVPASWSGLRVTLAASAPDLIDYTVRMRSVRGGAISSYSNESVYHRPLNAPQNVTARFDWNQLAPTLQWNRHSTAASGVSVQRLEVDANGVALGTWTELAVADPAAVTFVDTSAAMKAYYRYQIANVAGAATSAYTPSSRVLAGLSPPSLLGGAYFDTAQQAAVLHLAGVTPDADGLWLERQPLDASFVPMGPWETVPVPAGVPLSLADTTWPELTKLAYRVSNLHGTYSSAPTPSASMVDTPLYQPAALAASSAGNTIHLGWQNRSLLATQVEVSWSPQIGMSGVRSILATLPVTAVSYDATGLGLGYYKFTVAALKGASAGFAALDFTTPNPVDALSLVSVLLAANDATDAVALPNGSWAFLRQTPNLSISSPGDPWPAVQRTDAVAGYAPVLEVDAAGRPHVVYAAAAIGGGDPVLTHLWYDGAAWTSEPMLQGPIASGYSTPGFRAAIDSGGTPQAIVVLKTGPSTFAVALVRKNAGAWTNEPVAVPSFTPSLQWLGAFGLDTAGNPHLVVEKTEYARDALGAWSTSAITPIAGADPHGVQDAVWADAGNAVVLVHGIRTGIPDDFELGVVEKSGGTWQPLRILARDRRTYGVIPPFELAATPDRSRVAILHGTEVGVRAYHRSAGTWHATLVAPPQTANSASAVWPYGFLRAGFDSSARAHFLLRRVVATDGYLDLREP